MKQIKRLLAYSLLMALLVILGMNFFNQTPDDLILDHPLDIQLVRDEVEEHLDVNLAESDVITVLRHEDLGEPFNHQATDFIYLDTFLKNTAKTKLIIDEIRAQAQATNDAGVFSNHAANFIALCAFLNAKKIEEFNVCESSDPMMAQLEIGDENDFGYLVVVLVPNSSEFLLRRFWALGTAF